MKSLIVVFAALIGLNAHASSKKILVVLSGESKITLKNGVIHPTGFFLSEFAVPVKSLIEAGYEPVFATPDAKPPTVDKVSDAAVWFEGNEAEYKKAKDLVQSLDGLRHPHSLSDIWIEGVDQYAGIFLPGGHAPMEDLIVDKNLGKILNAFHKAGKPTALICHAPIALLSTLPDARKFRDALAGNAVVHRQSWIYEGYAMTSFSTKEEQQEEPGQDNALGGFVQFYPAEALAFAGGNVSVAEKWHSHVVRDRELITGQNPMSDTELSQVLLKALSEQN